MRILVTGREGQVALSLERRCAASGVPLATIARPVLDMTRPDTVRAVMASAIAAFMPTVIVNAAAYTAVDQAEDEPDIAHAVNAASAADAGLPVIHISTDYVFDGEKAQPYVETDPTGPQGVYGVSKLAGEQAVAAANPNHVILRTAWVYSPFGRNFVKTMLTLAETRDELRVVADQHGNPTSADDIAAGVIAAAGIICTGVISTGDFADWGVFHLAGTGDTHWAGFAAEIFRQSAGLGGPSARVIPITSGTSDKGQAPCQFPARLRQVHGGVRFRTKSLAALSGQDFDGIAQTGLRREC